MMSNRLTNCYKCVYRKKVKGSVHSSCDKPDPKMKGDSYGIKKGWFDYPYNFDPIWKTKLCNNFKSK